MNKDLVIAGYHLLTILSSVDGDNDPNENAVIMHFLHEHFPLEINADEELVFLDALNRGRYEELFTSAADTFNQRSNDGQRLKLLQFADRLINADNKVTDEERTYFKKLCKRWSISEEEAKNTVLNHNLTEQDQDKK